ncbi:MAG: M15 family metallopeptidase [Lachnospiraceae bacterium]|nr:M15 family metallopeptidase [Lachnospiraceae bacterium]
MKKLHSILSIVLVLSLVLTAFTGCGGKKDYIDYLVLVNKTHKLPDTWEETVRLKESENKYGEKYLVEEKALESFYKLQEAMAKEGVVIELDSTYRSVKEQQQLWDDWTIEFGEDYVKTYVAVPGFSEHHTGLAIDICIEKGGVRINDNDEMIAEREIFAKIHEKLADYGFILRYLEGKEDITGYGYEPWHFRYVGKDAAKKITEKGLTLEEYLDEK